MCIRGCCVCATVNADCGQPWWRGRRPWPPRHRGMYIHGGLCSQVFLETLSVAAGQKYKTQKNKCTHSQYLAYCSRFGCFESILHVADAHKAKRGKTLTRYRTPSPPHRTVFSRKRLGRSKKHAFPAIGVVQVNAH